MLCRSQATQLFQASKYNEILPYPIEASHFESSYLDQVWFRRKRENSDVISNLYCTYYTCDDNDVTLFQYSSLRSIDEYNYLTNVMVR